MRQRIPWMFTTMMVLIAGSVLRGSGVEATAPRVEIKQFKYAPPMLTVPVGGTVTWINSDEEPHTVTSATGLFASPGLDSAETFSQRFTTAGTYTYFCALHPYMTGTVLVK